MEIKVKGHLSGAIMLRFSRTFILELLANFKIFPLYENQKIIIANNAHAECIHIQCLFISFFPDSTLTFHFNLGLNAASGNIFSPQNPRIN